MSLTSPDDEPSLGFETALRKKHTPQISILIRWGNTREPAIGGRGRGGVKRFCSKLGSSAFQAPPGG